MSLPVVLLAAAAAVFPLHGRIEPLHPRVEDQDVAVRTVATRTATVVRIRADVLFAFDSARLRPAARATLRGVERRIGGREVTVAGFTDARGTAAYNRDLSRRRAVAAARALGLPAAVVEGHGELEPVASNATGAGRARNRRVEVRLARQ